MILTLDEYKQYLPLNALQNNNAVITEAHETRALYKWFPKYLGMVLVNSIAGEAPDDALLEKAKPVLANFSYLEALPFLNLVLTGSGFGVISNPNMAPASTERVRALAAGLMEAAHNFLDTLLKFLEDEADTYPDWNESSMNSGSLIPDAETFDSLLNINESRVTFVLLKPHITYVENIILANKLSDEFLAELIAGSDANVKPMVQHACANWAWARMMEAKEPPQENRNAAKGIRSDADYVWSSKKYLYQKTQPVLAAKTAEEYLLKAIAYLNKNLLTYTTYAENAYQAPYENSAENGFFIT